MSITNISSSFEVSNWKNMHNEHAAASQLRQGGAVTQGTVNACPALGELIPSAKPISAIGRCQLNMDNLPSYIFKKRNVYGPTKCSDF